VSHFPSHSACLISPLSVTSETVKGVTAILGHARVSTTGQDLDAQLGALMEAGVERGRIFTDKLSGAVNTGRPGTYFTRRLRSDLGVARSAVRRAATGSVRQSPYKARGHHYRATWTLKHKGHEPFLVRDLMRSGS
jgi:hypothetical protein